MEYKRYLEDILKIKTLRDAVDLTVGKNATRIACQWKPDEYTDYKKYTYAELGRIVRNLSKYLFHIEKIKKGDRVAVLSENRPEWIMAYIAIVYNGGVVVPIDARLNEHEIKFIVEHSEPAIIFISRKQLDKISQLTELIKKFKRIVLFDPLLSEELKDKRYIFIWDAVNKAENEVKELKENPIDPEDLAAIIYTSGTTGTAKGVMLTHKNISSQIRSLSKLELIKPGDVALSILPLHHTYEASTTFWMGITNGATITFASSLLPKKFLEDIKNTGVNKMMVVPLLLEKVYEGIIRELNAKPMAKLLVKFLELIAMLGNVIFGDKKASKFLFKFLRNKAGFGKMEFMVSGASPLPERVSKGLELWGFTILNGYGLTEASPVVSVNPLNKPKNKSVGLPIPDIEVRIYEPNEEGIGEIIVKGDNVMKGYYKNEQATKETIDPDGWLHTGDLGKFDEEGYLYVVGRIKNLIVTHGGKNVYPEELEEMLNSSPYIMESLVIGIPKGEGYGEEPYAIVVPDLDSIEYQLGIKKETIAMEILEKLISEEIKKVNEKLPIYKRIKGFKISMEELPKTSTRKIKRYLFKLKPDEFSLGM